jgi:hypothetical protein
VSGVASTPAPALRRSDPRLAAGLSTVPGLGQLYTGQPRKAGYYFAVTLLLLAAAILVIVNGVGLGHGLIAAGAVTGALLLALATIVVFLGLLIAGLFVWASAAVDAYHSALEIRAGGSPSPGRRHFRL